MDRKFDSSDALIKQMYREALGRAPNDAEMKSSTELVGSPAKQEGVEDLLWSL